MVKIKDFIDYTAHAFMLPDDIRKSIGQNITNWVNSGGLLNDDYVKSQYQHAENILNDEPILQSNIPFVAFCNREIKNNKDIATHATCPNCGKKHDVVYGEELLKDGTRKPSKKLAFVKCSNGSTYLIGINGKLIR